MSGSVLLTPQPIQWIGSIAFLCASVALLTWFGYHAIRERFKSRVTLRPQRREIDVVKIDGPFAYLANRWRFHDVQGGCEVHFYIDYAFGSRMLALLMGSMFDAAFARFSVAFEKRADAIYGRPKLASS